VQHVQRGGCQRLQRVDRRRDRRLHGVRDRRRSDDTNIFPVVKKTVL
jgi:hypothetical protein